MTDTIQDLATRSEEALLAHVLYNPDEFKSLSDIIGSKDFYLTTHQWVWQAMETLRDKGMGIDVITVGDELARKAQLDEFQKYGMNGRAALSTLKDQPVTGRGLDYAITVQDYAIKRSLLGLASRVAGWASNGRTSAAIIADVEAEFAKFILHSGKVNTHTVNMEVAAARAIVLAELASSGERALETGLADLDKFLYPQKTELITVAGRPGQGKSSLLATIAINAAKRGKRIKYFSCEMGSAQIAQRMISQLSGVSAFDIMRGRLNIVEWEQTRAGADELSSLPITICDLPAISVGQIRTESRREPVDAIILDYVQLARADKKNERRDLDIGEITGGLKALAIELDVPIIIAAQMSRNVEGRAEKRPTLADLRESGNIENDSDSVVFIYQKEEPIPGAQSIINLIIEKHRSGPKGEVSVMFDPKLMKFYNSTVF